MESTALPSPLSRHRILVVQGREHKTEETEKSTTESPAERLPLSPSRRRLPIPLPSCPACLDHAQQLCQDRESAKEPICLVFAPDTNCQLRFGKHTATMARIIMPVLRRGRSATPSKGGDKSPPIDGCVPSLFPRVSAIREPVGTSF